MAKHLQNTRHDYIRYANCWEDADVLLDGLQISEGDRVLSIGSAGDNSFSLLADQPELVIAVDINAVQLKLIELKKAAFKALNYEQFIQFLGFEPSENRSALFDKVKAHLTLETKTFWDSRMDLIQTGIVHQGKFEKYFQLFHKKVLPLIHSRKNIENLLHEKSASEQEAFYRKTWNSWRWQALFKVFFSKFVMGRLGRDPDFLKEVEVPVSTFILSQAEKHLSSIHCQKNYFLRYILTGDFGKHLPHFARPENFEAIKSNIDKLVIFEGLAEDALQQYSGINKFNLSNIFEYMNPELFQSVAQTLTANAPMNSRFVYWNLMVPRSMAKVIPALICDETQSSKMTSADKGFFYANVFLDIKQ